MNCSIWPLDGILTDQSGSETNGNEGAFHIP